jgi:putative Mg2+ transporter-C (MgtC) family protein
MGRRPDRLLTLEDCDPAGGCRTGGRAVGFEREKTGKAAGLLPHAGAIGSALFVIVPVTQDRLSDMSRVIQGIVTGIGFLGGGAILKLTEDRRIKGLTTAAGIWIAAAIGTCGGFGRMGAVLLSTLFALAILSARLAGTQHRVRNVVGWQIRPFWA